jgi:hypothetical protein
MEYRRQVGPWEPCETLGRNRIARRTVPENGPTKGIIEKALGPPRFGTELFGGLGIEPLMSITVRRHFVSAGTDGAHQLGVSFGNPPQNKKVATSYVSPGVLMR